MFDDLLFFPAPIFSVQTSRYRTDKQTGVLKNPAQEEGVERVLFIWFSYPRGLGGVQFGI